MRLSKTTVPKESDENPRDHDSAGTGDVESPIRSETDQEVEFLLTPRREAVKESALVVEEEVFESPIPPSKKKKKHPNAGLWE